MALKNTEHKSCTGLRCSRILMDKVHKTGTVPTIPKISELWGLRDSKNLLRFLGILGLCRFVKMIHYIYIYILLVLYILVIVRAYDVQCSMRVSIRICAQGLQFSLQDVKMKNRTPVLHVGLRHDLNK